MTRTSRLAASFIAALMLFGLATRVCAQRNPTMPSQQTDNLKEALYAQFTEYKKSINPEERRLAYPTAKEFMRRFGGDNDYHAREVQRFIDEYDRDLRDLEILKTYNAKNYPKTFELGRAFLKTSPDDFFVLGVLAEAGYEHALAGDASLNAEVIEYTRKAISLLESGKVSKADPFKSMDLARGFLNFSFGWFLKDQSPVEAAAAFLNAVKSDSPYRQDSSVYYRLGVAILKGEFAQLSAEYNQKFGSKQASPEQAAMLNQIKQVSDRAIDAYARAVALMTKPEQQEARNKILAQLTALYKSFHGGSDAGLNEMIATVLSKPLP
ncbi:MAG: hypothetical protein AABM67_09955 [Acidobacteriota bacterium]